MKPAAVLIPVVFAAGWLLSPSLADVVAQPVSPTPTAEDAREIWMRDCAYCHGAEGEGTARGPGLEGTGAAYTYYMVASGRMPIDRVDEAITRSPARYSSEEIEALSEFVGELVGGPDIPDIRAGRGDLASGAELYLVNCSACHGAIGVGTALPSGDHAPPLRDMDPREVAATMILGPGAMPTFVPPLSRTEMESVIRYVLTVRDPDSPGGHGLFFVGPIMEGLTALLVGLAGLMLVARWIGKKKEEEA